MRQGDFILAAIERWYGSSGAFTAFVQNELRWELVKPILSSSPWDAGMVGDAGQNR